MYTNPMTLRRLTRRTTIMLLVFAIFLVPILARVAFYAVGNDPRSWRDADWSSTGLLPRAADYGPARVIVFTGTTGAWKGVFSVHSWVVFKRAGDKRWTRYDVVGWGEPVRANNWPADGRWYGNMPTAIADVSGAEADKLIPRIEEVVKDYAYARAVLRGMPELGIALPPNAVGRDYRDGFYIGRTDSGTGVEINLGGYAGIKVGWVEGVEVNLLGLVAGVDLRHPGVKLPGYGRIGLPSPVATANAS